MAEEGRKLIWGPNCLTKERGPRDQHLQMSMSRGDLLPMHNITVRYEEYNILQL